MTTPNIVPINAELYRTACNLVQENILQLRDDPDSIMTEGSGENFKFVADPNSSHGIFSDMEAQTVKNARIIGELGLKQMVNQYFTLTARDKAGVPPQRITTQKTKVYVIVPGTLDISEECKELLRNQFRQADAAQRAHERKLCPPTEENGIRINDLIRDGDGTSMVTTVTSAEKMWTRVYGEAKKPKDIFDKQAIKEEPLPDTLATWYDPEGVYSKVLNKNDYKLNTGLQVFDADDNLVHPSNYDKVLLPGAWVIYDAHLRLWDFTRTDPQEKTPGARTRTYHWEFSSIHVIMPPIQQPVQRKRVAETSLSPAPFRPLKFRKLTDVLGRSANELFTGSSSSSIASTSSASHSSSQSSVSSFNTPSSSPSTTSHSQAKTVRKYAGRIATASKKGKEKETDLEEMEEDL